MANGCTGTILRVDLSTASVQKQTLPESFYRTYMGGGAFGTYFLLTETTPDLDPLEARNVLTIAPGVTTGAAVSGVSRCSITALSPETGAVGDTQAGGSLGPMLKRAGYDAVVVSGRSEQPCYLLIDDGRVEIRNATHLRGKTVLEVHDTLRAEQRTRKTAILQCGPAGEKLVRFACLMADLNDVAGRTGMGAVFGSKNLRAVVVCSTAKIAFADPQGLKELARGAAERLPGSGFPAILRKYGTPGVLAAQAESGNLATHNFTRGYHPDYKRLDGAVFEPDIGAGHTTCFGCAVGCRKKVRTQGPYHVSDRLGGPEFETLSLLGSNVDITDAAVVAKANELCNNYGLDTIAMGGMAAYLFECVERGLVSPDAVGTECGFGSAEGLLRLIEQVAQRDGVGDVLAQGFEAAVAHFGPETAPLAIHVKNHGLAAHMPQVKPSQALMYAVCPIGADHMSSEHDWLLASGSEACRGLGILGEDALESTGLDKVRMTAYSQYYYSLLDTLCLCMFCWNPGGLFQYHELLELLRCTTGWNCTFWELMKVGERRINMMRHCNARRGFTRDHDRLPKRLSMPLPDGPAKGRYVDPDALETMLGQYYDLMGWDRETGNPTRAKMLELGLDWAL